ncbi:hypothetical protein ACWD5R_24400 [Streptomyces sp. NPDC002514]|uniref:hypothetical protein n=1 Tax=Streptomyces sp. NPDC001270 TaxID=3364554 RepID=UPI00368A1645
MSTVTPAHSAHGGDPPPGERREPHHGTDAFGRRAPRAECAAGARHPVDADQPGPHREAVPRGRAALPPGPGAVDAVDERRGRARAWARRTRGATAVRTCGKGARHCGHPQCRAPPLSR